MSETQNNLGYDLAALYGFEAGLSYNELLIEELRDQNKKLIEGTFVNELEDRLERLEEIEILAEDLVEILTSYRLRLVLPDEVINIIIKLSRKLYE